MAKAKRRPGRPSNGLSQVLYLRVNEDLIERLDQILEQQKQQHPGRAISRADVAREFLYNAALAAERDKAGAE